MIKDPEKRKQYIKQWVNKNRDKMREYYKKYHKIHPEKTKQTNEKWRLKHPEYGKQYMKQYYKEHKEQEAQYNKQWKLEHPDKIRKLYIKHWNKRERNFGFFPLNEYFEGSVAHHIDYNFIIYIPEEVHRSIYHSVLKNINMDEINAVAWNYLGGN